MRIYWNTESFKSQANKIHNNLYNYDKFVYVKNNVKGIITCKIHGDFKQSLVVHFRPCGCPLCGIITQSKNNTRSIEDFIELSNKIHSNKYNYTNFIYKKDKEKSEIICPLHGSFFQTPSGHLVGKGCRKCGFKSMASKQRKSNEEFLKEAISIHGDKYSYNDFSYNNGRDKIIIHCNICNTDFKQIINDHIKNKSNCSHCWSIKRKTVNNLFKYSEWEKLGHSSKNFDSFKVYIIKCWNDTETFYKIGKSYTKMNRRFPPIRMPYNYEILKIYEDNAKKISELEHSFQKDNKQFKYIPNISFEGMYECFSQINNYDF